jgi:hypothetical protein
LSIHATSIRHKISDSPLCQDVIAAMNKESEVPDMGELMRAGFKNKGFYFFQNRKTYLFPSWFFVSRKFHYKKCPLVGFEYFFQKTNTHKTW